MYKYAKDKWKKFFSLLGPGFISGAADDDPTAIATYTQSSAQFGLGLLWTSLFSLPFMVAIQEMCGRIGMVTGMGLTGVIKKYYSRKLLFGAVFLLLLANIINIGANLGAMAASAQLLFDLPFVVWLIAFALFSLTLELSLSYKTYSRYLKYLALFLVSYVILAFFLKLDWKEIFFATIFPNFSLDKGFLLVLVAILGTNISPYLFFWQASEEVEEEVEGGKLSAMGSQVPAVSRQDIRRLREDTFAGMLFSQIIAFFIAITAAHVFAFYNIDSLAAAENPANLARMLTPIAGSFSTILFVLGIVGSGLLAVPILSGSASYAIAECFGWREGFYQKWKRARGFYLVIIIATLIGLAINFIGLPPFRLLVYSAALNGLLAPFLLVMILFVANNKKIMNGYHNRALSNIFGILITVLLFALMAFFLFSLW